jgi:hypothetical protein
MPDIDDIERDLTGLDDCDTLNAFKLKHFDTGEIRYTAINEDFNIGDAVNIEFINSGSQNEEINLIQKLSPGQNCWIVISKVYANVIEYMVSGPCDDVRRPGPSATPTSTPTPTPTPTNSPTPTPTSCPTPTSTETPTPTPTISPTPTDTPVPTSTETPTPTPIKHHWSLPLPSSQIVLRLACSSM